MNLRERAQIIRAVDELLRQHRQLVSDEYNGTYNMGVDYANARVALFEVIDSLIPEPGMVGYPTNDAGEPVPTITSTQPIEPEMVWVSQKTLEKALYATRRLADIEKYIAEIQAIATVDTEAIKDDLTEILVKIYKSNKAECARIRAQGEGE